MGEQPTVRVVFGSSVEALWKVLRPPLPQERAAFAAIGAVEGRPFNPAYPLAEYQGLLRVIAQHRFGQFEDYQRFVNVGRLFTDGFADTLVGRAMAPMLRLLGPRRTLQRMTRNFRQANNYTEVTLDEVSPGCFRVRFNYAAHPGFVHGVMARTLELSGAADVRVVLVEGQAEAPTFEVRWAV